jgi:hypothetical protein
LDREDNVRNFGESNNNENVRYERAETGMDNTEAMERSAISGLVEEPEKRSGISKVIAATNTAGSISAIYDAEELEELEARGIDPYFDKTAFRKALKDQATQNEVWLDKDYLNDKTLLHDQKQTGTSENDVYINVDGNTLTKLNNLSYVKGTGRSNNMTALVDRLSAHNALFPNAAYTIKGFMDNKNGFPSLATEQPYIKNAERNATQEEIDSFLTEHSFKKDGIREWSNGHEVWSNGKYEFSMPVRPMC